MLRKIDDRLHSSMQFQAALHGVKLPKRRSGEPPIEPSLHENEAIEMDKALQAAKMRKQEAFAKRHGK